MDFNPDAFDTYDAINISTRYFTSRHDDANSPSIPFTLSVDPKGILKAFPTDRYFHGEDNEVLYYTSQMTQGTVDTIR